MKMDRRTFPKLSGTGLGCALLGSVAAAPANAQGQRLAMLYDNARCIGCRACQMACKQWNHLPSQTTGPQAIYASPYGLSPAAWTLIRLAKYPVNERRNWVFTKEGCMHCGDPACAAVCPTSALKKQPNGPVTYERELCNGCGYCTQFCPFGVPQLEATAAATGAAKSSKCTFCQDRVADDLRPFCIESCPAGALEWSDREATLTEARSRVEALKGGEFPEANLYGEKKLGGLGRLYVLLAPPPVYGLPQDPKFPASASLSQRIVQPLGQVAFGLAGLGMVAAFFGGVPILYAILQHRRMLLNLTEFLSFGKYGLLWLKGAIPYYVLGRHGDMPPQPRFNTGERLTALIMVLGTATFGITGLSMWFLKGTMPVSWYRFMVIVRDLMFIVTFAMFMVHFCLAVIHPMMWQSLVSMRYGIVSESYAREHHAMWYCGEERAKEMWKQRQVEAAH